METVASHGSAVNADFDDRYPGPLRFMALADVTWPCMTIYEHAALGALARMADNETGLCAPKIDTIAARGRMSYASAHEAVHALHAMGWLRLTSRRVPGQKTQAPNVYELVVAEHDDACQRCATLAAARARRHDQGVASSRRRLAASTPGLARHQGVWSPGADPPVAREICSPDLDPVLSEPNDDREVLPMPIPANDHGPDTKRSVPKEAAPATQRPDPVVQVRHVEASGQIALTELPAKPRSGVRRKQTVVAADPKAGEVHAGIIACYAEEYLAAFGRKPAIGERDAKGAKLLRVACENDLEWACRIIRDAFQNEWFRRADPSLHRIGLNPNGIRPSTEGTPSSPSMQTSSPEVDRVLKYWIAVRTKYVGASTYQTPEQAPAADRRAAAALWADAIRMATQEHSAEACLRYWVARYFGETGKTALEGFPFPWISTRIGSYGMPERMGTNSGVQGDVVGAGGQIYRKVPAALAAPVQAIVQASVPKPIPFAMPDFGEPRKAVGA